MTIAQQLMQEFSLKEFQVVNTLALIDEGKTIPFIARYRKEATGEMSDELLRDFDQRLTYLRGLADRKEKVVAAVEEQGKLTEGIRLALEKASTLVEVEDIYEPYKKKRKTRATVAIEKGLESLAMILAAGEEDYQKSAEAYVDMEKGVEGVKDALQGACDILAQNVAEDFELKKQIRSLVFGKTMLETSMKSEAEEKEDYRTFEMYFEYQEKAMDMPPHRVLAVNRGEKVDILKVKLVHPMESITQVATEAYIKTELHREIFTAIIEDAMKRLMLPALEREVRNAMTENAEERAISVFGQNLKQLLLQSPLPGKVILGWDPAFRTGCKIAVVDGTGKLLETTTVYPTEPQNKVEETKKIILRMIQNHHVDVIAIGNGTASRESQIIVADIIKEAPQEVKYLIVSEAGASIYSASKLGTEEFPNLNVSLRGAVSIARRVTDPLAELVKIEPQHIGVGQYQHDVNQKRLGEVLDGVVEDAVNKVGVDLNTASVSLLSRVSGVNAAVAKNMVEWRETNGEFTSRRQLLKVKRLGDSAFEQCAGFLRIKNPPEILDNTGVHPESYDKAYALMKEVGIEPEDLVAVAALKESPSKSVSQKAIEENDDVRKNSIKEQKEQKKKSIEGELAEAFRRAMEKSSSKDNSHEVFSSNRPAAKQEQKARVKADLGHDKNKEENLRDHSGQDQEKILQGKETLEKLEKADLRSLAAKLEVGFPTLRDIVQELKKPGRDIREQVSSVPLRSDVLKLEDLAIGMKLQGTVRNVVDFGAFVDIGLKNDGLVHVSQLSDQFVKDPMTVVSVGDVVEVSVIKIDMDRGKVGLSMKKEEKKNHKNKKMKSPLEKK